MSVEYTNRAGKTYYLLEGKTKTGKPRYFFSPHQEGKGEPVEAVPEGYEIYEHPSNAQVFLRKSVPRLITEIEEQLIKKHLSAAKSSQRYRIDIKKECLTIYESDTDADGLGEFLKQYSEMGVLQADSTKDNVDNQIAGIIEALGKSSQYTAVLRFCLIDKDSRHFVAARYSFRDSIDDWHYLDGPDTLQALAPKYISLLGTERFFNTPY
jgi:hypothetical protein